MSKVHELRKLMPDVDDEAIDLIFANKHIKVISHNAEDWECGLSPTPEQLRFYQELLGLDAQEDDEENELPHDDRDHLPWDIEEVGRQVRRGTYVSAPEDDEPIEDAINLGEH